MGRKVIVTALVAAAIGSGIPALAQDHGYNTGRDNGWQQRDHERASRVQRERDERRHDRTQGSWGRTADFNAGYEGAGPNHDLRSGEPLPGRYRTRQYEVDNWRAHKLAAPERGYHWIQAGADYVLVDGRTGTIAQIMIGR